MKTEEIDLQREEITLISIFMGYHIDGRLKTSVIIDKDYRQLECKEQWSFIMLIVAEIQNKGYSGGVLYDLREALIAADMERAYKAIIEYIHWYNRKMETRREKIN